MYEKTVLVSTKQFFMSVFKKTVFLPLTSLVLYIDLADLSSSASCTTDLIIYNTSTNIAIQ